MKKIINSNASPCSSPEPRSKRSATSRIVWLTLAILSLAGCTTVQRVAVPPALVEAVHVEGFGTVRFWGDEVPPELAARTAQTLRAVRERNAEQIAAGETVSINLLAISGGGGNGAFGAGFLGGWTQSGTRPEFQIVTGVSTGAIIAPFAFLGPDYDDELRRAYTEIGPDDIYAPNVLPNLLNGMALADGAPLARLIESFANEALLNAIAVEYAKGRRLLVSTTNIDAGRPVEWDLGAIAASGHPRALELFRSILLASSSLPGIFPPVPFAVLAGDDRYTELHVDGGVTSQVFSYQPQIELGQLLDEAGFSAQVNLYVIWNGRSVPAYAPPALLWYQLLERSVDVLFTHQGLADIYRIYALTERDGVTFHLVTIPEDFAQQQAEPFEQEFMRALFRTGELAGLAEEKWLHTPPD